MGPFSDNDDDTHDDEALFGGSGDFPSSPVELGDTEDDNDEDFKPTYRGRGGKISKKKRGRPKKKVLNNERDEPPVKRKRGRPPKVVLEPKTVEDNKTDQDEPRPMIKNIRLKAKPRNSGRPAGRPRKKLFPITVEQAKELTSDGSSIKPILVIDPKCGIFIYSNVRIQRENTTLLCKHPGCNFFTTDMSYFSDQLGFRTMKLHIKHHHRLKNYRVYTNSENALTPVVTSASVWSCCYCEEQFQSKNNLLDHVRNCHENVEPFPTLCEVCGDSMTHSLFRKHLYSHKNAEEKKVAMATKPKRRGLMKDTSIPLQFPCDQCEKVFKNQTELRLHRITHIPLEMRKLFQCDICNERYSNPNNLRYHKQRVHFKEGMEYPFVCHICNQKFNRLQTADYKDHLRSHSGERPFQCAECGKGFHRKRNLTMHESLHKDTKIQCEFCAEWYKNTKYLKRYHKKHHSDLVGNPEGKNHGGSCSKTEVGTDFIGPRRAHPCEPCGKIYVYKSQLVAHMKHRHKLFLPKSVDYPDQNTFEMSELNKSQT